MKRVKRARGAAYNDSAAARVRVGAPKRPVAPGKTAPKARRAPRRVLLVALVVVGLVLCVMRIAYVNATAIRFETERFGLGETVPFEGAYINEMLGSEGYSIQVHSMQRMTHDEFIQQYGFKEGAELNGNLEKTILCVDATVKNDAAEEEPGAIELVGLGLYQPNGDAVLGIDFGLWAQAEVNVSADGMGALGILPQSEYRTCIPYTSATGFVGDEFVEISAGDYELHLTSEPVRKLVEARVE